ncbi:MAG: chemotaxis protein CheB [Elainellaceae cyanobacterium]
MTDQDSSSDSSLIVGLGASAGGLNACSEVLSRLPVDTGMAFVLVQHLSPDQASLLSELLARITPMSVETATDGKRVQANHIYVIPPNTQMTIDRGRLHLLTCDQHQGRVKTIDIFFQSLAADQKHNAIAIMLSGSNDDGALGIQAIRDAGGVVFAQEPSTAEFGNMPSAAIATGRVNFILPPAAIAEELINSSRNPASRDVCQLEREDSSALAVPNDDLDIIFRLLHRQTGIEFTEYKPSTLQRRLQRRVALHRCFDLGEYIQYLQNNPEESHALYQDFLIAVTSFFRDDDVFQILKNKLFSALLKQPSASSLIRVWIPGCATGEEVYSMAICLLESLEAVLIEPRIQIFGTDVSDEAIETARAGIYPENKMEAVSAERRSRFFNDVDGSYQIKTSVRELCVFARQDLSSDPPFSDIDVLSCRNVLIYFKPSLQKRILSFFHYSLKPTGFLVLGNSEDLGETSDLFEVFDAEGRIYTRQAASSRLNFDFIADHYPQVSPLEQQQNESASLNHTSLQQWADQIVLSRYGPSGVVVNEQLEILLFRGDTTQYLRIPAGVPSYNLLRMIRPSLLRDLRTTFDAAKRQGISIKCQSLMSQDSLLPPLTLEVIPFHVSMAQDRCYLVLFEHGPSEGLRLDNEAESDNSDSGFATGLDANSENYSIHQALSASRQELLDTKTLLQLTIEEKYITNQQLVVANEEILSSNEELKSTNEELQTAKEELQSANEELKTTNEELHERNIEACRANDDLTNLLTHVNIPILMLSDTLHIRHFTPAAQSIFNLIPSDIGRSISDFRFGKSTLRTVFDG